MNYSIIRKILGVVTQFIGAFLLLPAVCGLCYGEKQCIAYFVLAVVYFVIGRLIATKKIVDQAFYAREGFVVVGLSWIVLSILGAIPLVITGDIPSFTNALFETVSGFTTTGSSILENVEGLSHTGLFWRSFTHWVGGMGVLVFGMIIIPLGGKRSMHLLRAESPGPASGKLVPKMRDTASILYGLYIALSAILFIFLLAGGMSVFDCFINVFGTAGTGGFSNHGASIAYYDSEYVEVVIGIFMILFGVNFNLYYLIVLRKLGTALRSEELHWYLGIIAFAVITIAVNINSIYGSVHQSVRHSFFQVASVITTTGFATMDFDLWPQYSRTLLVMLMFIGACAGSTGGGLKVSRVVLLLRTVKRGMRRMIHSKSVEKIRFEGHMIEEETINTCLVYLAIYCLTGVISVLLISLNNFSFEVNVTAVISCMNNIGPGLGMVGPVGNFAAFSAIPKLILSFDMLAGRLEFFPILLLFSSTTWKR